MSKEKFSVVPISKAEAKPVLEEYHYLTGVSRGFRSGYNYGCFFDGELVGVAIYTSFSVPELSKGLFGLERHQQDGLYELSRFCLVESIQQSEHNLSSWFLSRTIRALRKDTYVKAILSYADSSVHKGTIYMACNFKYYGLTALKKDFWILQEDGTYKKHNRGKVKGLNGEWRPRTQKHRFLLVYDKNLEVRWTEQRWNPNKNNEDDNTQV